MNKIYFRRIVIVSVILFVLCLSACGKIPDALQFSSEVNFSEPEKVQISFNDHIYDTEVIFSDSELIMNFCGDNDLFKGACVSITEENYKITYSDMIFEGDTKSLMNSFLPCIVYKFFNSFESGIILDSYDKEKGCYRIDTNLDNFFVTLEAYENNDKISYSMNIK